MPANPAFSVRVARSLKRSRNFYRKTKIDNRIKDEDKIQLWHECYGNTYRNPQTGQLTDSYLKRAQIIIKQLGNQFTFYDFAESLANYGKQKEIPPEQSDVVIALLNKSVSMKKQDRIGNAELFELAAKSLRRFVNSFSAEERKEFINIPLPRRKTSDYLPEVTLRFEHLTPAFLNSYEQWMQHFGKTSRYVQKI